MTVLQNQARETVSGNFSSIFTNLCTKFYRGYKKLHFKHFVFQPDQAMLIENNTLYKSIIACMEKKISSMVSTF